MSGTKQTQINKEKDNKIKEQQEVKSENKIRVMGLDISLQTELNSTKLVITTKSKDQEIKNEVNTAATEMKKEQDELFKNRKRGKPAKFLSIDKVMSSLTEFAKDQDFAFRRTEVRHVLMVGKTRSGKTTAVNTLKGVENIAKPMTLFSETTNVHFRSFALQSKEHQDFTISIIDTPGLFELKKQGDIARSDEEILSMIADCLKKMKLLKYI